MLLYAPLNQFQIVPIISLKVLLIDFSITNFFVVNLLAFFSLLGYTYLNGVKIKNSLYLTPNTWQKVSEFKSEITARLISDTIVINSEKYFPFISVLFFFILYNNLIGLIPYTFTSTSHTVVTFTLSFSVFIGATIITINKYKMGTFSLFLPNDTSFFLAIVLVPIEFISYVTKPFSLSIRLLINMMAGHSLLKVIIGFSWKILLLSNLTSISSLVPMIVAIILYGLETGVTFIQTYVFIILTCIYIQNGS